MKTKFITLIIAAGIPLAGFSAAKLEASDPVATLDVSRDLVLGCGSFVPQPAPSTDSTLKSVAPPALAAQAVNPDPNISAPAIAALRSLGPAGLEELWAANAETIRSHALNLPIPAKANDP